ncbi:MAG: hypothetical protein ACFNT9_01775 [Rodentibacter sp.]
MSNEHRIEPAANAVLFTQFVVEATNQHRIECFSVLKVKPLFTLRLKTQ